jgi:putative ABC transport system permease protein
MKTILRNLFYTLKRFRTASVLNLLGLSAAFAAFVLLMMKVSYERNFDTCYPHADRLVMYNPQNEMFRLLGTKRSFSQNETFFFSHPYPPTLPFSA